MITATPSTARTTARAPAKRRREFMMVVPSLLTVRCLVVGNRVGLDGRLRAAALVAGVDGADRHDAGAGVDAAGVAAGALHDPGRGPDREVTTVGVAVRLVADELHE